MPVNKPRVKKEAPNTETESIRITSGMTIDKAIGILTHAIETGLGVWPSKETGKDALKLGIEALKRVKEQRGPGGEIGALGLPGETEE